ncbi:magnesium transporter CorA family protein [Promineifilum sp.]|uniref:magnesium transporter CorA family protein n=1 Tax=Promineifilum sp. TaxID=2664178 RepID=UPI0035ADCB46
MVTIFRKAERGLEQIDDLEPGTWIHLVDPQRAEIEQLMTTVNVPEDFLLAALDLDEMARTDREDGITLIILRVPFFFGKEEDIPYKTVPFGIILTPGYLITICKYHTAIAQDLLGYRVKELSTSKHSRLVLQMLLVTAQRYLSYVRHIDAATDAVEERLQRSLRNEEVLELLKYQKSLVYFTTGLKSNDLMMQRLQKSGLFSRYEEDEDLLEDVLTENSQALEMTTISENILSQMMDAFASIISNNLNVVMKFLASITIVVSVPTLIASIYGMNVELPFQGSALAFWMVMGVSLLLALIVLVILWRRDWL